MIGVILHFALHLFRDWVKNIAVEYKLMQD